MAKTSANNGEPSGKRLINWQNKGMVAPNNLTNELTMYPDIKKRIPNLEHRKEMELQLQIQKLLKTPLVELSFDQYLKPKQMAMLHSAQCE